MTVADRARARLVVRDQVLTCTRCPLHKAHSGPVPFHGPVSATAAVLGEAPGRQEDKAGRPFVGPAGRLLRRLLSEAGIDPDELVFLNTVSCFPGRTPTAAEISACAANRTAQLAALAPAHVLVTGGVALSTVRPDLKITAAHGRLIGRDGIWFFPVHHPSAALRNPALAEVLAGDLARWRTVLESGDPHAHLSLACMACGRLVERYDPDGVAWCSKHHIRGLGGWERSLEGLQRTLPVAPVAEDVAVQGAML